MAHAYETHAGLRSDQAAGPLGVFVDSIALQNMTGLFEVV